MIDISQYQYFISGNKLIRVFAVDNVIKRIEEFDALVYPTIQEFDAPEITLNNLTPSTPMPIPKPPSIKINKPLVSVDIDAPDTNEKKKYGKYDKEAIINDIKAGLKTKEIAHRNNVTDQVVYNVKSDWKRSQTVGDTIPKPTKLINTNKDKVRELHLAGHSDEKIYQIMHDFMTVAEFREAILEAKGSLPDNV